MDELEKMVIERTQIADEIILRRMKWAEAIRQRRLNPTFLARERERNLIATRIRRQNPSVRARERLQNLIAARIRRQNPEVREKERERNRMAMRLKRQNPEFKEREKNLAARRKFISSMKDSETSEQNLDTPHLRFQLCNCHTATELEDRSIVNVQRCGENTEYNAYEMNGTMPLEMDMRVEEEDVDDPGEIETQKYSREYEDSEEEAMVLPVEVTITPSIEEFNIKEEDDDDESGSLDTSTVHEEVDIKEEEAEKDDDVLQPPLMVNIKEEMIDDDDDEEEEEEEVVIEPSIPDYESYSDENDIVPEAAMVVVPGRADEYPEGYVERNVATAQPVQRALKRPRLTAKRVDMVYRCPNCSLCYTSAEYLAGHIRRGCRYRPTPIKNAYSCIVCGEGFNNYGDLYQHKRQQHDPKLPSGKQASTVPSKNSRTTPAARNYPCPDCPRTFTAAGYLVQHQRSHLRQQTDHFCDLCGEGLLLKTKEDVVDHFANLHPDSKVFKCDHCQRIYGQHQNLVTHLQTHGEFKCHICCKLFGSKQVLSAHFRTHASIIHQYRCELCGKTYLQRGRYFEHRRREHDIIERPHMDARRQYYSQRKTHNVENIRNDDDDDDDDVQVVSVITSATKSGALSSAVEKSNESYKSEIPSAVTW